MCTNDATDDEDSEEDSEEAWQEIPLPNVPSHVLAIVLQFCSYHILHGPQLSRGHISDWGADFLSTNQEMLNELMNAATYLGNQSLQDLIRNG